MTTPPPAGPLAPQPVAVASTPRMPRWDLQTGWLQTRQPAFWMFVVLLVLGTLSTLAEHFGYLQQYPAGWFFSVILLTLYVIPVVLAIWLLDLFEREPLSLVIAAFVWGGIIATSLSLFTNTALLEVLGKLNPVVAQQWGAAIIAPPVEETYKFLGVVTIYLIARDEITDLFDGFVYGAIVGLGFAAVEHVQYFLNAIGNPASDQIGPVLLVFIVRAIIFGGYMHILWSGLTGLGLAYYVTRVDQPRQRRLGVMIGLFLLAILAHFVWNSPLLGEIVTGIGGALLFSIIKGVPFFIFLVILVRLAQRQATGWFRTFAAPDIGTDTLTQEEAGELASLRARWAARRRMAARKGRQGGRLMGQLQREQLNLAMMRSYAHGEQANAIAEQQARIRAIRAELNALPDAPQPVAYAAPAAPTAGATTAAAPTAATMAATTMAPAAASAGPAAPGAVWTPTHIVPATGMAAWAAPDPAQAPIAQLAAGVQLVILEQQGAWARVQGSNGWTGWVDGRLLTSAA